MRKAEVTRNTLETQISIAINIDGSGQSQFDTGLGFLDHQIRLNVASFSGGWRMRLNLARTLMSRSDL
jgi:imidazoleglycerol phosphate dehydratase HisB